MNKVGQDLRRELIDLKPIQHNYNMKAHVQIRFR